MASQFNCCNIRGFQTCYSPVACEAFGYCRERNFDGNGMEKTECQRRKNESDKEWKRE